MKFKRLRGCGLFRIPSVATGSWGAAEVESLGLFQAGAPHHSTVAKVFKPLERQKQVTDEADTV